MFQNLVIVMLVMHSLITVTTEGVTVVEAQAWCVYFNSN